CNCRPAPATIAGNPVARSNPSGAMPYDYHPYWYLYGFPPLFLLQGAFTIWMLMDANRRRVEPQWYWMILAFQPFGAWAYFFTHKVKDFQHGHGHSTSW